MYSMWYNVWWYDGADHMLVGLKDERERESCTVWHDTSESQMKGEEMKDESGSNMYESKYEYVCMSIRMNVGWNVDGINRIRK